MNKDAELRVELLRMLFSYTQTIRRSRSRPDLAAVAAEREIEFKRELEELEKRVTGELPLNGAARKEEVAA